MTFRFSILLLVLASPVFAAETETEESAGWDVSNPGFTAEPTEVQIDVTRGTWMSLDVSPDGKRIVFDLLGDIYELPITGGEATPIASGLAWDMQPRFSPDGTSIAFSSDRDGGENIWVMDLGSGDARQITYETFRLLNNPTWSPDGDYIAARKHFTTSRSLGTGEIWLYHASGKKGAKGVQVVERPSKTYQKELGEPMFSPDGKSIYYAQNATGGNTFIYHQDSNGEVFNIKKVDLATGDKTEVVGGPGGAVRPAPSPDGKWLAYVKRVRVESRLFIMNLETGEQFMLDDNLDPDMQETWAVQGLYPNMDWTPDSKAIVYWARGQFWKVDIGSGAITNIPFHVADTRVVYPSPELSVDVAPDTFNTNMVRFAQPSPDGKSIVFESLGRLYIKRGDRAPVLLTNDNPEAFELEPVWSPDGSGIYFLRWSDASLASIHRVRSRGGKPVRLDVEPGHYTELSISGDGSMIAYRKQSANSLRGPDYGQEPGLYVMDLKDSTPRLVTRQGVRPHFGPSDRLYFNERSSSSTNRGSDTGKTLLMSVTLEGHDAREHAASDLAREIFVAPDGKTVAFREGYHVYASLLPMSGQAIAIGPKQSDVPSKRLSPVGGEYLYYSADGRSLSWSVGPTLKTININDALFSDAEPSETNLSQSVNTAAPDSLIAMTNARIVTMDSERSVIENGVIVVERNRIKAVGSQDAIDLPAGATVVDLAGKTVIPGMIDAHAHGPHGSGEIILQQNWNSLAHLALGVTTMHNPSSQASLVFAQAEYQRAGKVLAPRIYSTGEIVYGAESRSLAPIDSLDDAISHVNRLAAQGAISIKNYNQPRRNQRQQVIEAARQAGVMTVAEGGSLFHLDMNLIADGISGIEHNLPTMKVYDDVTQYFGQSTAGYTPTLVVTFGGLTSEDYFYQEMEVWKHPILSHFVPPTVLQPRAVRRPMAPDADYRDDDVAATAKQLMEAGVSVHTGAHGQREGLATHWEMWSFARGGMTPMQVLSTSTINPAQYLGLDHDLGSIEAGKLADLVVINGNPLEDIRQTDQVEYVVLNGRVYEAATLTEVFSGDATLAPFWWNTRDYGQIR